MLQHNLVVVGVALRDHSHWSAHDRVKVLRLVLDDVVGLAHHDGGKGQVDEAILEFSNIRETLSILINLVANNTSDHSRRRCNRWDNFSSNHFGLVAVAFFDLVIAGTQVGASSDEVDMEVRVVVLLEVGSNQGTCSDRLS